MVHNTGGLDWLSQGQFVGTESAAVAVLAAPPLSAATLMVAIEVAASERTLLTAPA